MQFTKSILIAAVAVLAPIAGHAATLTSSPSLSVGGLSFDSFSCSISKGGIDSTPNSCSQINVNTITAPGTGIELSSGFFAAPFSFDDAVLHYHVTSSTGISAIGLDFNGFFLGYGVSSVTESVFSGSNLVGFAKVSSIPGDVDQTDNIVLNGVYNNLTVEKDINVTGVTGVAEASIIDQTFTQAAPEPSSIALFGTGLIAAAGLLRRRSTLRSAEAKQ